MMLPVITDDDQEPVQPTLCRMVHYRAHGSLDGRYPPTCRAAVVTGVPDLLEEQPNSGPPGYVKAIQMTVLNPTGVFMGEATHPYDAAAVTPGSWHWPQECPDGL
jgi:hypothetical protein